MIRFDHTVQQYSRTPIVPKGTLTLSSTQPPTEPPIPWHGGLLRPDELLPILFRVSRFFFVFAQPAPISRTSFVFGPAQKLLFTWIDKEVVGLFARLSFVRIYFSDVYVRFPFAVQTCKVSFWSFVFSTFWIHGFLRTPGPAKGARMLPCLFLLFSHSCFLALMAKNCIVTAVVVIVWASCLDSIVYFFC